MVGRRYKELAWQRLNPEQVTGRLNTHGFYIDCVAFNNLKLQLERADYASLSRLTFIVGPSNLGKSTLGVSLLQCMSKQSNVAVMPSQAKDGLWNTRTEQYKSAATPSDKPAFMIIDEVNGSDKVESVTQWLQGLSNHKVVALSNLVSLQQENQPPVRPWNEQAIRQHAQKLEFILGKKLTADFVMHVIVPTYEEVTDSIYNWFQNNDQKDIRDLAAALQGVGITSDETYNLEALFSRPSSLQDFTQQSRNILCP
ncbi:MAG: hypothetical protein H6774_00105 [Pseudomonadales bacterium]|nr:hypothetical protein [Candidatus Woesebacteria bacterium]MCB9801477.1 hypothetical protein [Pseudomonadales bacterium]